MKHVMSLFRQSAEELRDLRTVVATAMLVAIAVVLGFFTIQIGDFLKIGVSFIANELTALLFGPVVGGIMAGIADLIKYVLKPTGPFFFGFTFNAILGAVIYGMMLYKKPVSFLRIFVSKITVALIVNVALNTLWLSMLYGQAFMVILPARFLKQIIMVPVQSVLFYIVARTLLRTKIFVKLYS